MGLYKDTVKFRTLTVYDAIHPRSVLVAPLPRPDRRLARAHSLVRASQARRGFVAQRSVRGDGVIALGVGHRGQHPRRDDGALRAAARRRRGDRARGGPGAGGPGAGGPGAGAHRVARVAQRRPRRRDGREAVPRLRRPPRDNC